MFEKTIYIKRRNQLQSLMGSGILLLPGNGESSMNYTDNHYPFRQDSTFLYFTGIDLPDLYFLIDIENNREILFGNNLTPDEIVWTGPVASISEFAERAGIAEIKPLSALASFLSKATQEKRTIHYLPPYRNDTIVYLSALLELSYNQILERKSVTFIKSVVALRSTKDEEEVKEIEKAIGTTVKMHRHAILSTRAGMTENEIAAELQSIATADGGNLSFPTILTTNGEYLHKHPSKRKVAAGEWLICDAGAETALHYAGDMTRTFPVGKKYSQLQKDVYEIVLAAFEAATAALKPGMPFRDIHLLACTKLAMGLKDMGLMKGSVDEAIACGAHALFFPCGLGHMMGLDVHDMENLGEEYVGYTEEFKKDQTFGLRSLRLGKALEVGFVLTVEPGLYFNPILADDWKSKKMHVNFINYDKLERFRDFGGVRIEEDFLITSGGSRRLGPKLEKTLHEIEKLIESRR